MKPLEKLTHYEVLEIEPRATPEDVRRAFDRLQKVFAPGSLATYSLVDSFDQQKMLGRLEEAFTILSDPDARAAYDRRNEIVSAREPEPERREPERPPPPPEPELEPERAAAPAPPLPPAPDVGPETPITGQLLRRIRESRGLTLRQVADVTRIGPNHLLSIEEEAWEKLPDRVYLRGFLVSYARELRLDPIRVSASYLARRDSGKPQD